MRERISSAHVLAVIAILLALGGNALAFHLGKNSVGSRQLRKNAVTTVKIKNEAVTAGKVKAGALTGQQINSSTLGKVPTAQAADIASSLGPAEAWHGLPLYAPTKWHNSIYAEYEPAGFYKDHEDVVHLRGKLEGGIGNILATMPSGYRPAVGRTIAFPMACFGGSSCASRVGEGFITKDAWLLGPANATVVDLDGITFRAES